MDINLLEKTRSYLDFNLVEPELHRLATGCFAIFSCRSPLKDLESANQDAAALIPAGQDASVLAVADGCGGMAGGEQAARIAIESLASSVKKNVADDVPLRTAVLDGIEQANRQVRELGTGAGTTISVVEVSQSRIRPYHVGDSMILLVGNRGKIKLQTKSHSPVGYALAAGVLDEEDAIHHDERHLVSNVVGTDDTHIEIGPYRRLAQRDTLLIASDGLADNLHVEEIVEIIRKGDLATAAGLLVSKTTQRMKSGSDTAPSKPDDLTFILFRVR